MESSARVLGVLIPCRDEAAVIRRRLASLARSRWPEARAPHRLLVIDDGSCDGTAGIARAAAEEFFEAGGGVRVEVLASGARPGKAGALSAGLARLEGEVDLIVLTDADVVNEPEALEELTIALESDTRLGMVSGAQVLVHDLAEDGRCLAADLGASRPEGDFYDRWTAAVRRLESRKGRLFSVHGQLLAWRAGLGLAPAPGVAADDLDLMLQVRSLGLGVALVGSARFLEEKTPRGPRARAQDLRRARAYIQALGREGVGFGGGLIDRLQWWAYRHVPLATPWLALALTLAAAVWGHVSMGPGALVAAGAVGALALLVPAPRRALSMLLTIARATLMEAHSPLPDHWEMKREAEAS